MDLQYLLNCGAVYKWFLFQGDTSSKLQYEKQNTLQNTPV